MTEVLAVADAQADVDPRLEQVQALNQRLDQVEEFYLPEVIEHDDGTPLARVRSSVNTNPNGSKSSRHRPQITLVREGHHHVIDGVMILVIVVMFVSTLVLMAQALVWLIVS
jgi:hypothetical protein